MKITVKAEPRSVQGTGASRRLRRESKVPGVLYGAGKDAQPIQLDHKDLWFKLKMEAFHASVLDMEVGSEMCIRDSYQSRTAERSGHGCEPPPAPRVESPRHPLRRRQGRAAHRLSLIHI